MNDIQILQEMLNPDILVDLQPGPGRPSAQLTDSQSGSTVEIKGLPPDSIVIRAEDFKDPLTVFNGTKGERKRADFAIVSNDERGSKWIVCIETQDGHSKSTPQVVPQLRGAYCVIGYCKCIGKSFWGSEEFLEDYQYRFVSIVDLNFNRSKQRTQPFQSTGELHDRPDVPLKILRSPTIYFRKLIDRVP